MAYPCSYSTQDAESSSYAEWVNYFSNPDVDYYGLPTGTSVNNNARVIRDNMVRPERRCCRPAVSKQSGESVAAAHLVVTV